MPEVGAVPKVHKAQFIPRISVATKYIYLMQLQYGRVLCLGLQDEFETSLAHAQPWKYTRCAGFCTNPYAIVISTKWRLYPQQQAESQSILLLVRSYKIT